MAKIPSDVPRGLLNACRAEPLLGTAGRDWVVEIPQRVVRQRRRRGDEPRPPLSRMVTVGRQAAEVRVRLYLWMFACLSTRSYADVDIRRTTGDWAPLLNLIDPSDLTNQNKRDAAARRVSRAVDYLVAERLIGRVGDDTLRLLEPSGDGYPYSPWTEGAIAERARRRADLERFYGDRTDFRRSEHVWEDRPLRIPATLWTNGTVSILPAPALVVLLVLWDYGQDRKPHFDIPKSRAYEYPISHSTWQKGTDFLRSAGLASATDGTPLFGNQPSPDARRRHRLLWSLNYERLLGVEEQ